MHIKTSAEPYPSSIHQHLVSQEIAIMCSEAIPIDGVSFPNAESVVDVEIMEDDTIMVDAPTATYNSPTQGIITLGGSETQYICCNCGSGPWLIKTTPACLNCGHRG